MNIFFLDYRFIRPTAWQHILEFLKIQSIFSFQKKDKYSEETIELFSQYETLYKGDIVYFYSRNDFPFITWSQIYNKILSIAPKQKNKIDKDFLKDSNFSTPFTNLNKTDDPNFLVLGEITPHYHVGCHFETYNGYHDLAHYIAYTIQTSLKCNNSFDADRKICFYKIDSISGSEFYFNVKWTSIPRSPRDNKRHTFWGKLCCNLNQKYPELYPTVEIQGKKSINSIFPYILNFELLEPYREIIKEEKRLGRALNPQKFPSPQRMSFSYHNRIQKDSRKEFDNEVDSLNKSFYDEIGESSVNIN